jgi:Phage integrase, N-terminal SAM-like domain
MEQSLLSGERIYIKINAGDDVRIDAVKRIPGKRWHPDEKRWSLPDTPANRAWARLETAMDTMECPQTVPKWPFKDAVPLQEPASSDAQSPPQPFAGSKKEPAEVKYTCRIADSLIWYVIPRDRIDQRVAIKKIEGCRWNPDQKAWSVPDTPENRVKIKVIHTGNIIPPDAPQVIAIRKHPRDANYIGLELPISLLNIYLDTIKNIHGRRWNQELNFWEVPYTQLTLRFLNKYLSSVIRWTFQPDENLPERMPEVEKPQQFKPYTVTPARYEAAVTALEECLRLKRYSHRTIKSYKNSLRAYFRFYDDIKPSQITRKQINAYINILVRDKHITESYQNQICCAIKMFYAEVVHQEDKVQGLVQAKKPQKIPQVLTEGEVTLNTAPS